MFTFEYYLNKIKLINHQITNKFIQKHISLEENNDV